MEQSRDKDQKRSINRQQIATPNAFFNFHAQRNTSFSYQSFLLTTRTHGLEYYCFSGQGILYQLCGLWELSKMFRTLFLIQKWLQLLGWKTENFQEKWQQRFSTGTIFYNGRTKFQTVHAIEDSDGRCRSKPLQSEKLVLFADTKNLANHRWTNRCGLQGDCQCGSSKLEDLFD